MQVSEAWLRELVNPPVDTSELVAQLTMAGLEVDAVTPVAAIFSGVVVAEARPGRVERRRRLEVLAPPGRPGDHLVDLPRAVVPGAAGHRQRGVSRQEPGAAAPACLPGAGRSHESRDPRLVHADADARAMAAVMTGSSALTRIAGT